MSNVYRHRYYDTITAEVPVATSTGIEIGDFVLLSSNYAIPASSMADAGSAGANREGAADIFVGIALSAHTAADATVNYVLVGTDGVYELAQKSAAAIDFGDPIGIYASASACEDQTCVEDSTSPIAVCWKAKSSTTDTAVLAKLIPSKLLGTVQS